ncbi:MAG TPA: IS1634 family transposase [Gemmatimonadales bacterium]|nr:IS1634 family transposase [Gemmatimonadales bacterium]
MYLRHTTRRKDGKVHRYWQLVRSVRIGRKVVQQTVAYLGELDAQGRARAQALARAITGDRDQPDLFITEDADEAIPVRLKRIRLERGRGFGDVWLGWTLWRALRLDEALTRLLPEGREAVPWATMAAVLVLARLCEPSSELHIAETWYRGTALEDLLALPTPLVNDDRLYRALDRLVPHKPALEQHLVARLGELFALDYDLLLYDVTSVYFEGLAETNPLAQRGHSRDHRPDCKQVCLALVVTRDGMPLGYEVFAGNRTDVTTVEEIVEAMEVRYGLAQRIWVMDRGMTSQDNLDWLRETGRRYLVGTAKSELKKWAGALAEARDWQAVREGIEAKQCLGPDGVETFVLIRSVERREKERAMHARFTRRIEDGLTRLGQRIGRARRPLDVRRLERQLGRLLERNQRAAGRYVIDFVPDPTQPAGVRLDWSARPEWDDWAHWSEGCYVLRTNVTDWSAEDLWRTYIQLTDVEAAFRIQKSELGIRPVWHQRADRVQAHILVCFLAYVLWKTLEQWQRRAGLGQSPRTIFDELRRIQSTDVVLPTEDGRELRLRCIVHPDAAQAALLDRLGLDLPQRLRVPPPITRTPQM